MTDLDKVDQMASKVLMTLNRILADLQIDDYILADVSDSDKIQIFSEAMSASGLTFLNYIQAKSEREIDNG
jgi:hypothetical protein